MSRRGVLSNLMPVATATWGYYNLHNTIGYNVSNDTTTTTIIAITDNTVHGRSNAWSPMLRHLYPLIFRKKPK